MLSIIDALDDPNLFGPWGYGEPSWATWRAVLKGAFGLRMTKREREFFRRVAERDPPKGRVKELWTIVGRRGGKDSIASVIATYIAAFGDYSGLRPGEPAYILCLAVDKEQAVIALELVRSFFERIPLLKAMVTRETKDGVWLNNGARLAVHAANFRGVRGRTIACAILDEVAYWRSDESASPDTETYAAIGPALATLADSMIIGISSPYRRGGLLFEKWREHYGKADDDVLVVRGASRTFNETLPQKKVDADMASDPAKARAEWLGEWRDDVAAFLPRELVESAVDEGVIVRPRRTGLQYQAFCDPSGGVGDSFTLAIAHRESESNQVLIDCMLEIKAPFNSGMASKQIADTLKSYGLGSVVGDRYAGGWVRDTFDKHGITYQQSGRDRSAVYGDCLPLFTAGRARLLDNPTLVTQLCNLERRTLPGGKDRIDHPRGLHDDVANSACGALVLVSVVKKEVPIVQPIVFGHPPSIPGGPTPRMSDMRTAGREVFDYYNDKRPEGFTRRF